MPRLAAMARSAKGLKSPGIAGLAQLEGDRLGHGAEIDARARRPRPFRQGDLARQV
jgi:hypothetical protein